MPTPPIRIEINSVVVPTAYLPQRISGIYFPGKSGDRDLTGRPLQLMGFGECVLWWEEVISLDAYQYWLSFTGRFEGSVWLSNVVLPDPDSFTPVGEYDYHSRWPTALFEKIERDPQSFFTVLNRTKLFVRNASARVVISQIGNSP